MAIFGAPVAHEDDPERAVRAALAIREELAADGDLEVHIGITTGEALITLDARIEKGEHTASGDSVNTAARLEAAAPAGSIFVDEATRRATERSIEFDDAPPVVAKGKSDPIRVWDAVRPRTPVAGRRASDTPLVGRERELTLLRGTMDRVQREREPELLTLVGVPGTDPRARDGPSRSPRPPARLGRRARKRHRDPALAAVPGGDGDALRCAVR